MSAPILGLCVWGIYARQFILPSYGVQWMDYFRFHTLGKFPAFGSREEVLEELTGRQMESLLRALAEGGQPRHAGENPSFDQGRFLRLRGE